MVSTGAEGKESENYNNGPFVLNNGPIFIVFLIVIVLPVNEQISIFTGHAWMGGMEKSYSLVSDDLEDGKHSIAVCLVNSKTGF